MMNNDNTHDAKIENWHALSIVKFICVAVMIFVHAHLMLITTKDYSIANISGYFYKTTSEFMFIGLFVFILPIIAGAVFRMDLNNNISKGKLIGYDFKQILNASLFLMLVGFFMNLVVAGPLYAFSWNVLQLMALSLIVIVSIIKFSSVSVVFLSGFFVLISAQPLREFIGNAKHFYLIDILIGGVRGFIFWPFFPWFSVVAFGFLFVHLYLKYNNSLKFRIISAIVGLLFLMLAFYDGTISPYLDPQYVWGPSLFQPKIGFVLAAMGLFCIMMVIADYFFRDINLSKYGIINSYSKGIIWIYVFQMIVNIRMAILIKHYYPMDEPSFAYFILPILTLLTSWIVGVLCIKLLQEKLIVIRFKKINEK